jgi:hypothetical protein
MKPGAPITKKRVGKIIFNLQIVFFFFFFFLVKVSYNYHVISKLPFFFFFSFFFGPLNQLLNRDK